jgi:hypothetical protein
VTEATPVTTVRVDGSRVRDIASFYDALNRAFMAGESWQLGPSLDALDDLLYGGFGALHGAPGRTRVVLRDHERIRRALGRDATLAWRRDKLARPGTFDAEAAAREVAELEAGRGQTYFDIVLDVFAGHPEIELVLD